MMECKRQGIHLQPQTNSYFSENEVWRVIPLDFSCTTKLVDVRAAVESAVRGMIEKLQRKCYFGTMHVIKSGVSSCQYVMYFSFDCSGAAK